MKYRRMTLNELESLQQEFIYFLVANGIPAEVWERIKKEDAGKMNALLDEFSVLVFQTSIEKAEFLLNVRKQELMLFHCKPDEMQLYSLSISNPQTNLSSFESVEQMVAALKSDENLQQTSFSSKYRPDREQTIYELLESGCGISDRNTFEEITSLFK